MAHAIEGAREAAARIVKQLGGFALAVELVGAYLAAHPSVTYAGLAEGWGLDDLDAMVRQIDRDAEQARSVLATCRPDDHWSAGTPPQAGRAHARPAHR